MFQRLQEGIRKRITQTYNAFGQEQKREVLERYKNSPYKELQTGNYPNNPDKNAYLQTFKRLRFLMIMFKLGYRSREMNMALTNSTNRYPEAFEAFERELEDVEASRRRWAITSSRIRAGEVAQHRPPSLMAQCGPAKPPPLCAEDILAKSSALVAMSSIWR